jgi:type II secretory pathway component PulF
MPKYQYSAIQASGTYITGEISAGSRREALENLQKRNFRSVFVFNSVTKAFLAIESFFRPMEPFLVTTQLALSLSGGINMEGAIDSLLRKIENWKYRPILTGISEKLKKGSSVSDAFGSYPVLFDPFFISMIKQAESDGSYINTLIKIARIHERESYLARKIRSMFLYPSLFFIISTVAVLLLLFVSVPHVVASSFPDTSPFMLRSVMIFSQLFKWIHNHIAVVSLLLLCIYSIIVITSLRLSWIYQASRLYSLKIPVLGKVCRKILISITLERFRLLNSAGVASTEAIKTTILSLKGSITEDSGILTVKQPKGPNQTAGLLIKTQLFPQFIIQMISGTENNAALDKILDEISHFYYEEVDSLIDAFNAVFEPFIVTGAGLLAAIITGLLLVYR